MLMYAVVYAYYNACPAPVPYLVFLSQLAVTVRYENETYTVEEGEFFTLALVLEGEAVIPVTVSVNTLNPTNNSVGDAAIGELGKFYLQDPLSLQ